MRQVPSLQDARGGAGMHLIQKSFKFSAAHCLPSLGDKNKCYNVHGHNYVVTVGVEGNELDQHGMVIDCAKITKAVKPIIEKLDHTNLNDHFYFKTTSENLSKWFYHQLSDIRPSWVEVAETDSIKARYWE